MMTSLTKLMCGITLVTVPTIFPLSAILISGGFFGASAGKGVIKPTKLINKKQLILAWHELLHK